MKNLNLEKMEIIEGGSINTEHSLLPCLALGIHWALVIGSCFSTWGEV